MALLQAAAVDPGTQAGIDAFLDLPGKRNRDLERHRERNAEAGMSDPPAAHPRAHQQHHSKCGHVGDAVRPPRSVERIQPSLLLERLATSASKTLGCAFRVVVRLQHDCPACFADAGALFVLLTKLIASVAGDMPRGGVIALSARPASDGSRFVEFVVRDEDHCSAFSARIVVPAFAAF